MSTHKSAQKTSTPWVVYLSTFPPRECGIATFTQDLVDAFDSIYYPREESKVIAINTPLSRFPYPRKVISQITQTKREDYTRVARELNAMPQVKLVNIQHEFGIFGGEWGDYILDFLKEIRVPVVVTFHTVLPNPNPFVLELVKKITDSVARIVVMTKTSEQILVNEYGIDEKKIAIIPHGIHPLPYITPAKAKRLLKIDHTRTILSTFGLLGPGKGIEYALEALPEIIKQYPNTTYYIIGATHPVLLREQGEAYRNSLGRKVFELGLENNVRFINKYLSVRELLRFLQATDIYLSLSQNPDQAVSGTLSYSLGAGRPVISTAFKQAKEDLTDEMGILVGFKSAKDIQVALLELLGNKEKRMLMGQKAYFRTRRMEWRNVIISYMREYIAVSPEIGLKEKNLPSITLRHFTRLTDSFGMFQFAKLTEPDLAWGYTLDDNARALIAVARYHERFHSATAMKLAETYLAFIEYCGKGEQGFQNYVNTDKTFHHERNTTESPDDPNSRALHALTVTAASRALPEPLRKRAAFLFKHHTILNRDDLSTHSRAFYIKALCEWLTVENTKEIKALIARHAGELLNAFNGNNAQNWHWFEDQMTYSNGVLCEALILAYEKVGNEQYLEVAKQALDFLVHYSFQDNLCVPIGQNGWFRKGGQKHVFDQQPEEVAALVQAIRAAYRVTKDEKYKTLMSEAFMWFLGNNMLGQVVYDQATGGCYDGLGQTEVNLNQGAESTVTYLLARLEME